MSSIGFERIQLKDDDESAVEASGQLTALAIVLNDAILSDGAGLLKLIDVEDSAIKPTTMGSCL